MKEITRKPQCVHSENQCQPWVRTENLDKVTHFFSLALILLELAPEVMEQTKTSGLPSCLSFHMEFVPLISQETFLNLLGFSFRVFSQT